jgi:Domain of unknown function (DUF2017)
VKGFRATAAGITIRFKAEDAELLADLAAQLAEMVSGRSEGAGDPAIARLLPIAYLDNDENAAEFRRFTEDELADEKVRGALSMSETLNAPATDGKLNVRLDAAQAFTWLRTFTDLRLALAARLGVEDPEVTIPKDEAQRISFAIYYWLGELQWSLVKAVDQ